jgi:DNA polymerase
MNALPVPEQDSARRREDVLRELNLYPLWQRRQSAAPAVTDMAVQAVLPEADPVQVAALAMPPSSAPATPEVSQLGWAALKQHVKDCTACSLRAGCTQTVFGAGAERADWLFVGSWPTEYDDMQGQPFAGPPGQLLDNMLAAIGLKRGNNVYLCNVVKCTGSITRGPQPAQITQCAPYLSRQIALLQPRLIVALGHATATALLGEDREWSSLLGRVHDFRGLEKADQHEPIPLIITHHPAALLLSPLNKAQTWRDLCLARDTMQGLV